MARGGHFEPFTQYSVLLLRCIVGIYVFILYMVCHLNVGYDKDDVLACVT